MIRIVELNFGKEEEEALVEVLRSKKITRGERTKRFEEEFASYIGGKRCFTVCSGTTALFVALKALGVDKGDFVVVPALSFMATVDAVLLAGGKPFVIDVDEYYTMDLNQLEDAVKKVKPKVVLPVHLYGCPCDMEAIMELSNRHGFFVLEDCAQSHGAHLGGKKVGSFGHLSAFSFYASKNLPMGEGGAIVINDQSLEKKVKEIIDFGEKPAFNFRITEFQSALGLIGLKKLDERNERRRKIAKLYTSRLKETYITPKERGYHVYHLYTLRHGERDKIVKALREEGIEARVYYDYLLNELRGAPSLELKNARKFKKELFSIPVHPHLKEEEVERIVNVLLNYGS